MRLTKSKKRISMWSALVVFIVLFSLLSLYSQTDDALDAPVSNVIEKPSESIVSDDITLAIFEDKENHYTIGVPDDWTKVIKDGYNTFIHSPSKTSIQIQTFKYAPTLLLISSQSISQELSAAGYSLQSFSWNSNTCYTVIYQKYENEKLYLFAEITYFDQVDAIRLAFVLNGDYVNKSVSFIGKIADSFIWDAQHPFPDGTIPYYSEYGKYQFVYPSNWNSGVSDNVYYVQDASTGCAISFMATESNATYEKFTKLDYAKYASNGRSSYILQQFTCDNNIIYAEGTYISGTTNMILIQYLVASGSFEYAITFEIPQNSISTYSQLISNIITCFKIYD